MDWLSSSSNLKDIDERDIAFKEIKECLHKTKNR